jgi:serine/threonine-protein kinase
VPRALSDVLLRMLAKAPEERYRTGAEVHAALLAAAAFGRRAPWEASLFEWEEVPGEKEGDAPVRRIRRPAFPTRPVTPAPPRVRLLPGGLVPWRRLARGGRAEAPVEVGPGGAGRWRVAGVVLALGLAGVAARGCVRAGGEVARGPDSSHTGLVAAPLPVESTSATAAPLAASSQDETSMKAKQRNTPTPPSGPSGSGTGGNTLRNLCLGAGAASQVLACAGAPVRQAPPPENCPAGSLTAMTETLGDLFSEGSNRRGLDGPTILLNKGQPGWMSAPEGPISAELDATWGKLPENSVLTGKLYVKKDRVYGRFTQVWTPQGTSFFICAELWELSGTSAPGLETRQGPRSEIQFFSLAAVRPVRHFE